MSILYFNKKDNIYASTGSDTIYLETQAAENGGAVSYNKGTYRYTGTTNLGSVVVANLFPIKAPCLYICKAKLSLISTVSPFNILAISQEFALNQATQGSAININAGSSWVVQSTTGCSLVFSKNSTQNSVDATITQTIGAGNVVNYVLEVEIFAAHNF